MLTTAEASAAIAETMPALGAEPVALGDAVGRILRQDVNAERDQPPFDRVMMDGIAVSFDALARGEGRFDILGTQHAGDPVMTLDRPDGCIEIMTGSVLPRGADCVVPVERITVRDGKATLESGYRAERKQFIHPRGSDHTSGSRVLVAGNRISPMDVAVIASCGLASVSVARQPSIRVVSTGNELVPPGRPLADHQIRSSNGPAIVAMLHQQGYRKAGHEHLVDDPELMAARLEAILDECDTIILSGGVSMGKADFVPGILDDLGVRRIFHKIRQRPGRPMWFGIQDGGKSVFALPGNPVSSLVCCRQYVLPALGLAAGAGTTPPEWARLREPVSFEPDLTCFLPVRVAMDEAAILQATPAPTNTSGDFAALSGTDGYVELERERSHFEAGDTVRFHRWERP